MNKEEIIRMAREVAGVAYPAGTTGIKIGMSEEHIEHFANLVAAHEREECAKACEDEEWRVAAHIIRERGSP